MAPNGAEYQKLGRGNNATVSSVMSSSANRSGSVHVSGFSICVNKNFPVMSHQHRRCRGCNASEIALKAHRLHSELHIQFMPHLGRGFVFSKQREK